MRSLTCLALITFTITLGCGGPGTNAGDATLEVTTTSDAGPDVTTMSDAAIDVTTASDATTDGSSADVTTMSDATADAAPISAPNDQWTWIDFPDSKCADGSPTGIAINPHAGATDLVLYLQGGGECSSGQSCWGADPSAVFLDGFGAAEFAQYGTPNYPVLDRGNTGNPLRAANMVFVPYCTGDLHAGSREVDFTVDGTTRPTWFWGARDLQIFLERLVPTFPGLRRVYLSGVSAGGFGTILSYDAVAHAFGVRVDAVDDSGPPILGPNATRNGSLLVWGYVPPTNCASPCESYAAVYASARALQPSSRFGFLLYAYDTTISARYHYATPADYSAAIDAFSASLAGDPNAATYIVDEADCDPVAHRCHVIENDPALAASSLNWIDQLWSDNPAWASTRVTVP